MITGKAHLAHYLTQGIRMYATNSSTCVTHKMKEEQVLTSNCPSRSIAFGSNELSKGTYHG